MGIGRLYVAAALVDAAGHITPLPLPPAPLKSPVWFSIVRREGELVGLPPAAAPEAWVPGPPLIYFTAAGASVFFGRKRPMSERSFVTGAEPAKSSARKVKLISGFQANAARMIPNTGTRTTDFFDLMSRSLNDLYRSVEIIRYATTTVKTR